MKENVISVKNVTLKYRLYKRKSIKDYISNIKKYNKNKTEHVALNNLTLDIEKGKIIGIIGSNGAGKSTLLKVIAGIYEPNKGEVVVNAEKVSLLSLGLGFNENLTGIDNIYLNASLLGLNKKEIDNKIQEIVGFSELKDFVKYPVKTYSSGMKSKLKFAIAINISPKVLLMDEIFSVGDLKFREKSEKKIMELIQDKERTVIMVSHSMGRLKKICDEIIWLENGQLKEQGNPKEVINNYKLHMSDKK